jgi:hypothetical protein
MKPKILSREMTKQKAPDARLERNAADGLFAKPSNKTGPGIFPAP